MLGPEPLVLIGRQCYPDAQRLLQGKANPYGYYSLSWYGTVISDERGSFGVVDPDLGLAHAVGDVVEIVYYPRLIRSQGERRVRVYIIGSQQNLGSAMAITRRNYMALELLAVEPIVVSVGPVGTTWPPRTGVRTTPPPVGACTWGKLRDSGRTWAEVNAEFKSWDELRRSDCAIRPGPGPGPGPGPEPPLPPEAMTWGKLRDSGKSWEQTRDSYDNWYDLRRFSVEEEE